MVARRAGFIPLRPTGELKVSDTPLTLQVTTVGSVNILTVPVPGSDYTNRIGRKVNWQSLYVKGRIYLEAASSLSDTNVPSNQARLIFLYDKQPNGALPSITDILTSADPTSHLNLNNRDRFTVLKDKMFVFDPYSRVAATDLGNWNQTVHQIKFFKKLNLETVYNAGTAGTVADINTGSIIVVSVGTLPNGTGDVNCVLQARMRFKDE